jgi:hypothetical protein
MLTDPEEKYRDPAQAPHPQPYMPTDKMRGYLVTRLLLNPGEYAVVEVGFIPSEWLVYCRFGADTSGYYVSATSQSMSASLWQRADKSLKIPGIANTYLYVQADQTALEMYVVALNNLDITV